LSRDKKNTRSVKKTNNLLSYWNNKKPVLVIIGLFVFFIALFYILWISSFGTKYIFEPIISFYASASAKILAWLGYHTTVSDKTVIFSPLLNLNIKRGCDAIEATALFISAILAFPARYSSKVLGILIGTVTLMLVNFLRIITLFITGLKHPALFNFMHDQIWQIIYIAIAVLLLILWLQSLRHREG
jgi:exosortase/archaeosortase family protein